MDYRLDYLEKSKKFEDRLKELKSEIHALKLEEKQSGLYSHWTEVLGSLDRSLGNVSILNTCHFFWHNDNNIYMYAKGNCCISIQCTFFRTFDTKIF